jgi:phosphatidylserine/phosphatidylglycerophosphate/cardiolipin synthase-like enzyme
MDGTMAEAASFNFTSAVENKNAENVLVLHDPAGAQSVRAGVGRLWGRTEEMGARY